MGKGELAALLAAATAGAALTVMLAGPVIKRLELVAKRRDPIVEPFRRIYQDRLPALIREIE